VGYVKWTLRVPCVWSSECTYTFAICSDSYKSCGTFW